MDKECNSEASWEVSKENVQPLRTGRNVGCLKAVLQPSVLDIEHILKERRNFEEEILADENLVDPIDAWSRYLKWTQQNLTLGENIKTYETFLKKYIVKFLKHEQYKNDPRYVNAWLLMAQISEDSESIFAYMRGRNIGTACASYYVTWADDYEKYGKIKKASSVYRLGEQNEAQPAEILSKMKRAFETRVSRQAVMEVENRLKEATTKEPRRSPERKVLAYLSEKKSESTTENLKNFESTVTCSNIKPKMNIYCDGEENVNTLGKDGDWAGFPCSSNAYKENNTEETEAWQGTQLDDHLKATTVLQRPHVNKFKIFEDEIAEKHTTDINSFSSHVKLRKVEQLLTEQKSLQPKESSFHRTIREMYGDSNENLVQKYPVDKIYSVMGEFQPEEIFAACWKKRNKEMLNNLVTDDSEGCFQTDSSSIAPTRSSPTTLTKQVTGEIMEMFNKTLGDDEVFQSLEKSFDDSNRNEESKMFCKKENESVLPVSLLTCESNQAEVEKSDILLNGGDEKYPSFLDDVSIAQGQCVDNSAMYCNNTQDVMGLDTSRLSRSPLMSLNNSTTVNFGSGCISAESTSYKMTSIKKCDTDGLSNDNEINARIIYQKNEIPQSIKLSPILEASDESEKSSITKFPGAVESFHQKSCLFSSSACRTSIERSVLKNDDDNTKPDHFVTQDNCDDGCGLFGPVQANITKQDAAENLCAEFMSTSVSERYEDENYIKLQALPDDSLKLSPVIVDSVTEVSNAVHSPSNDNECDKVGLRRETEKTSCHHYQQTEQHTLLLDKESSLLQISHDPWANEYSNKIIESSPHLKDVEKIDKNMPRLRIGSSLCIGEWKYTIIEMIAQGGFAKVYKATGQKGTAVALKVQSPPCLWEVHILQETRHRLRDRGSYACLTNIMQSAVYTDTSCIITSYFPHGTLLEYVSYIHSLGETIFPRDIGLQILQLVEALHSVDIIHGDIKPDNFLVTSEYKNSICSTPKLKLIDFGRAIDIRSFPPYTTFTGNCGTSGFVCSQMKMDQPWSYHVDYYGIAGTMHVVLLKKYMTTTRDRNGVCRTANKLPRYVNGIWPDLFHQLLNFPTPSDEWVPTHKDSPLPLLIKLFQDP